MEPPLCSMVLETMKNQASCFLARNNKAWAWTNTTNASKKKECFLLLWAIQAILIGFKWIINIHHLPQYFGSDIMAKVEFDWLKINWNWRNTWRHSVYVVLWDYKCFRNVGISKKRYCFNAQTVFTFYHVSWVKKKKWLILRKKHGITKA